MNIPTLPQVEFAIPPTYARTVELAYNLWWSWNYTGTSLWSNLDPVAWDLTHNPIDLLESIAPGHWQVINQVEAVQERYQAALSDFDQYMTAENSWYQRQNQTLSGPIAYLCTEFGIHASVPFYSGGLGILAGDHLKSASDLGLPLVAVGLLFRRGYFRQEIEAEGEQQHIYPSLDVRRLPVRPVASPTGGQLKVEVEFPHGPVKVAVWRLDVGRVPLLLLDTDIDENDVSDRPITHTLYVRGRAMRFCQEMILGIGGVRALEALGIKPAVWHINEGHAALALLELARERIAAGADLATAMKSIKQQTLFTLHTPVPAGNEVFERSIADHYLRPFTDEMENGTTDLSELGVARDHATFDLGAFAIQMSSVVNGVSKRHAEVATHDWEYLIGGPAAAVTNGVHTPSWIGRDAGRLLFDTFGTNWLSDLLDDPDASQRLGEALTLADVWANHRKRKEIFATFARGRLRRQFARHGASPEELRQVDTMLPIDRLTLGFGRRFAAYKRATLMFEDLDRFQALVTNSERPVQVVFAGKAHPADRQGQDFIKRIVDLARLPGLRGHVFVLENYDARMARFMVQGVDVWVNNPRPPMEASGTSGMKAAINGTLNLSILDGWWVEGFNGRNGWAFGSPEGNDDHVREDRDDAEAMYRLLEEEVTPLFYDRDEEGMPVGWVEMMREAIISTLVAFSSHRMVAEYSNLAYFPMGGVTQLADA
ncbi:MAG TPA: alpha-glucan family phosphorylase [Acidimicrobiia bacterium]|nr:alpha-glucan family phosphorylase [Acidimicrobiia bacterium]